MSNLAELEELRSTLREFVITELSSESIRQVVDGDAAFDRRVWELLAGSMGMAGIGVPEEFGGAGSGFNELGVVLEELGRSLAPTPYLSTAVLSVGLLLECGEPSAQARYLPEIAAGSLIATPIFGDASPSPTTAASTLDVTLSDNRAVITGTARFALDAGIADLLLVVAATENGWSVVAVPTDVQGLTINQHDALDVTRPIYSLDFDRVSGEHLGGGDPEWPALTRLMARVSAAIACEQVGGAAACLDMIVEYSKLREQFGRPIGSFQAIKHRCADLLVDLEGARSIAYHSRRTADAGALDFVSNAAAAKSWCSETYVHAAQEAIQLHGGIGFTWEHDAHLHLRRARTDQLLFGSPAEQRRVVATSIGI